MKSFKIKTLAFFVLTLVLSTHIIFSQTSTITATVLVQKSEKEVKILIKNSSSDMPYKITTVLAGPNGYTKKVEGIVDPSGQQITQSFSTLGIKQDYSATIVGVPVSGSGASFGPATYTFKTDFNKPNIVESLGGDPNNQTPGTIPDPLPPNTPTTTSGNSSTNQLPNPQSTNTTPGTVLTPEQVAADKKGNGLVPCKDTCDFNDILQLINNLITFLITTLFIPIIILLFMYAGFKYITAEGNPSKIANLKKMVWHIIVGMLLVLCSWLIVKTIISILSSNESGALQFLK